MVVPVLELAVQTWIVLTVAAALLLVLVIGTQAVLRTARQAVGRLRSTVATPATPAAYALPAARP